ncbi:glycogenin glucosyltransferase, putative [Trypanosoma cruzi marinkellei]|uniref:Glycogenin glucosyltransferase, putative n=1 Tax=Trypanosoma cruzi marinkellei TaxID=85056 RepID=K2NNS8_TRYCR|nr:glycogenin glucosyltransferase, putative [Trypanosoma cruzi marinkellei]
MRLHFWRSKSHRAHTWSRVGYRGLLLACASCTILTMFLVLECLCSGLKLQRVSSGTDGDHRRNQHASTPQPSPVELGSSVKKMAYAVVISSESYVDGALVVGFSLKKHSIYAARGTVDLVLLVPEGRISMESRERLHCAGWNHVIEVSDLSVYAPNANLKDTFSKLHVFNLTSYSRVAMFDGDILLIRNPDKIFDIKLPNKDYVGAIGSPSGKYFQTGVMLLIPSHEVFLVLLQKLKTDRRQQDYGGRDGRLIRDYFKSRYVLLDQLLGIHIHSGDPLIERAIGLHYRGGWKPWHNREDPPNSATSSTANEPGQEVGAAYHLWWGAYEKLHVTCMAIRDAIGSPTRDVNAPAEYDPRESMWLMRHTAQSYVQLMKWKEVQRRNVTVAGLRVVESGEGASCDEACNADGLKCVEKALSFLRVNSLTSLRIVFLCKYTSWDIPKPYQPSFNVRTQTCHLNSLYGKRERPTCAAKAPLHRRLCACNMETEHQVNPLSALSTPEVSSQPPLEKKTRSGEEPKMASTNNDTVACSNWFPQSMYEAEAAVRNKKCASFLSDWDSVKAIPRQIDARTIKLCFKYKNGISAIVKLEQLSFPLEPHAEYGAYVTSLLLGIGMVPPTELLRVPKSIIREALMAEADATERRFLQDELPWIRAPDNSDMSTVSVQLWVPDGLVSFGNAVPPITRHTFDLWLQNKQHNKTEFAGDKVMFDVATMLFFDYIIANEDRSFTHNANVVEKGGTTQLVFLDHGKGLHSDSAEVQHNPYFSPRNTVAGEAETKPTPMCKLPKFILRQALCLSGKIYKPFVSLLPHGGAGGDDKISNSQTLAGQLLRVTPSNNVSWKVLEKNILAVQLRLEKALEHFARCAEVFGLSHVIGE